MKNLKGMLLSTYANTAYFVEGFVVFQLPAGKMFTEEQMLKYACLSDKNDPSYRSVKGPAKVDRVVLAKRDGNYVIAPLHLFIGHHDHLKSQKSRRAK